MRQGKTVVLSVIIPVYNGETYIKNLIEMIAGQQFESLEVFIIDDGSVDQTYRVCEECGRQYSWISVIHTENCGVSHARNTGLDAASGKWIQFIDADDRIQQGMFSNFYRVLSKEKSEFAICGCVRENLISNRREICGPEKDETFREEDIIRLFDHLAMENRYWLLDYVWNKWYRRDIIEDHNLRFDERLSLGEDFVFNTQYMKYISSISLMAQNYYQYAVGKNGLVSKFRAEPWIGRNILFKAQSDLYKALKLWEKNEKWIRCQAGEIAFGDIRTINGKNCHYKWKEKKLFIRRMTESDQYPLILCYLKERRSLVFRIYYHVFCRGNENGILLLISLEKAGKEILKRKN